MAKRRRIGGVVSPKKHKRLYAEAGSGHLAVTIAT